MFLLHTLLNRVNNLEKGAELDYQWVEFGDVRYHVQVLNNTSRYQCRYQYHLLRQFSTEGFRLEL
ncbi:unnamed protein product [Rhodiola kirilowii]